MASTEVAEAIVATADERIVWLRESELYEAKVRASKVERECWW